MQQLLGGSASATDTAFLRELFLQHLPPNVRMVLASTNSAASLEELAELADKVMEVAASSISKIATPPSLAAEVEQLRGEVARLEKLFKKVTYHCSSSCHASRRSPIRTSDQPNPPVDSLCWYHKKFGSQAQHCKSPCSWQSNSQAGH